MPDGEAFSLSVHIRFICLYVSRSMSSSPVKSTPENGLLFIRPSGWAFASRKWRIANASFTLKYSIHINRPRRKRKSESSSPPIVLVVVRPLVNNKTKKKLKREKTPYQTGSPMAHSWLTSRNLLSIVVPNPPKPSSSPLVTTWMSAVLALSRSEPRRPNAERAQSRVQSHNPSRPPTAAGGGLGYVREPACREFENAHRACGRHGREIAHTQAQEAGATSASLRGE